MKFRLLVTGRARSPESLAAFRRAIEEQAYMCHPGYVGLTVEMLPSEAGLRRAPETARCGHCGVRLTAEEFSEHKCGSPAWPCHALPVDQWCDNRGPGDFMGHTCGPPAEVLKLIEEGAKSARWGLNAFRDWVRREPLDVVVFGLLMFVCGFAACKLLKP